MLDIHADSLYKEIIMEHFSNPRNYGMLPFLKKYTVKNTTCGDVVSIQIETNDKNVITEVRQDSKGCSISRASASIMTDLLKNKTLKEAKKIVLEFVEMVKSGKNISENDFGDAMVFSGIKDYPARFKCATISWEAILHAIDDHKN